MTRYLLDTNIISDVVRDPLGRARQQLLLVGGTDVCTSIVVAAELRYGLERGASLRTRQAVEGTLERLTILPLGRPADEAYGRLRVALEKAGTPIGANDLLIAAHALAAGCILVTDNEREFARVPGLTIENWLR